ncbi:MAG: type I-C CRISPR-associated endonuclease Cas1c [Kiritimatiellia bacterium]
MKKLLNTLFVTTPNAYLRQEGETLVVEQSREVKLRLPIHALDSVITLGAATLSPWLLNLCAEHNVTLSFLSERGKFLARVTGPTSGNVHLRMAQVRAHDTPEKKTAIAQNILTAKILNSRDMLLRRLRDYGENSRLTLAAQHLSEIVTRVRTTPNDTNRLRGLEGEAAATYFSVFNEMIIPPEETFRIQGRTRRPPRDPMNALLSFLYTLLAHDCRHALESVGLDPQIGCLHEIRPGRPSLALDLMEEFRAPLCDRLALSLVNLRQLSAHDFIIAETGIVTLKDAPRKRVLQAWQKKKQDSIIHPFLNERAPLGIFPHIQALLLTRHLRGDLDTYPPYLVK